MLISDDEARAIQESAKTASKIVDVVKDSGGFLRSVFGDLVEDSVGLVADKIKFYRAKNFLELREKTLRICREKNINVTHPLPPKFVLPLIEAATMEDDESIQDMYAYLMANALNPLYKDFITPAFISVLKEFTPFDALFFSKLYSFPIGYGNRAIDLRAIEWRRHLGIDDEKEYDCLQEQNKNANLYPVTDKEDFTIDNLERLGCARRGDPQYLPISVKTNFGLSLYKSCVAEK